MQTTDLRPVIHRQQPFPPRLDWSQARWKGSTFRRRHGVSFHPSLTEAIVQSGQTARALWAQAGQALEAEPTASAARLYVESLNEAFDAQSSRVYGLGNRVPSAVLALEIVGAAIALGLLALHLATLGRGLATVLVAAVLVTLTLVVTFDLDRPVRGLIQVSAAPLMQLRASMAEPPALDAPD
jgi:hypothetical protein